LPILPSGPALQAGALPCTWQLRNILTRIRFGILFMGIFFLNRPLCHKELSVKKEKNQDVRGSVAVIGAGIAGMQAALDLADSGFYVYLVEKSSSIGGRMAQLDKTYPTNDCSM
jgi:NADPH-dependent 2,4-dienoyl-CoA reductase/sulfur reductase-like enzyme